MFNLFRRNKTYIEISPSIVVFTVFFLLSLYFVFLIRNILLILLLSFILMVALSPAVDKLEKKLQSRIIGIIIVYILVIALIGGFLAFLVPPLANQMVLMLKSLNNPVLQQELSNLKFSLQEISKFAQNYGTSISAVFDVAMTTFNSFFTFLTLLVISFYLMIDEPNLHLKISWFTDDKKIIKLFRNYIDDLKIQLGGWVRGEIILMTSIGILTYFTLSLLQIPFALPLALLAAVLELLPNVGPTLAAVPAVIIAFFNINHLMALSVTAAYIIIQFFENNVLVPKILKENADVNPLISMLSILIGFKIGGVMGGLLAIPTYILMRTTYSYWRNNKKKLSPDW